jgi:uncharacterized protein (TIGR00369 family)
MRPCPPRFSEMAGGDMEETVTRRRIVEWPDPVEIARIARGMGGLEFLQSIVQGRLPGPPIAHLIGFRLSEAANGRVVFTCEPHESHYNPLGSVHGGVVATLLDSAMGCAVHSTLPAGRFYTTLEIKVNYIRSLGVGSGPVQAVGETIHSGRQTAIAEGRLVDEGGRLYAHATTTCIVFDLPGGK